MSMLKDKPKDWITPPISKMYLLIKDRVTVGVADGKGPLQAGVQASVEIDVGHAVNGAAHAGAMICFKWPRSKLVSGTDEAPSQVEDAAMAEWYDHSFRKVCCKVTEAEFEKAKTYFPPAEWFVVTESHFQGAEIILVFKPRSVWPPFFKGLNLYR